jgi:ATP-dependent DNA helicase UvrD/PcrA
MQIAQDLESLHDYLELNDDQRSIVAHDSGPLLVIAGPGSGKTRSLTLLAMNLLLLERAEPAEIILCTYTEKAAYEIQDRIYDIAKKVNYRKDISQMRVGTIHSICNRFIMEHLHCIASLGNNYETLDQLSQQLFIFEWMDEICKPSAKFFMNRWGTTPWKTAKKLQSFFDKITEELIDINSLISSRDGFLDCLANTYHAYRKMLVAHNRVDFAHLQKIVYGFLKNPNISHRITKGIRYVLVDEYQDTNYIQEQILIMLASETKNTCVVGDEDQAL